MKKYLTIALVLIIDGMTFNMYSLTPSERSFAVDRLAHSYNDKLNDVGLVSTLFRALFQNSLAYGGKLEKSARKEFDYFVSLFGITIPKEANDHDRNKILSSLQAAMQIRIQGERLKPEVRKSIAQLIADLETLPANEADKNETAEASCYKPLDEGINLNRIDPNFDLDTKVHLGIY